MYVKTPAKDHILFCNKKEKKEKKKVYILAIIKHTDITPPPPPLFYIYKKTHIHHFIHHNLVHRQTDRQTFLKIKETKLDFHQWNMLHYVNEMGWGGAENRMQPLKTKWLRPPWLLIFDAPHPAPPPILKEDTKQRCKLAWKHRKCANIFICRLCIWLFCQYLCDKQIYFSALNLSSSWASDVGLLFTNKNQKKAGSWSKVHFLLHMLASFIMTDLAWQRAHTATFKKQQQQLSTHKNCLKYCWVHKVHIKIVWNIAECIFIPFLIQLIGPVMPLCLGAPLNETWWKGYSGDVAHCLQPNFIWKGWVSTGSHQSLVRHQHIELTWNNTYQTDYLICKGNRVGGRCSKRNNRNPAQKWNQVNSTQPLFVTTVLWRMGRMGYCKYPKLKQEEKIII